MLIQQPVSPNRHVGKLGSILKSGDFFQYFFVEVEGFEWPVGHFLQNAQIFSDLDKGFYRTVKMMLFMRGGNLYADTCLAFWHDREEEANHIYTFIQQAAGKFLCQRCLIKHNRYNRVRALFDIESGGGHFFTEISCAVLQLVSQAG